MVANISGPQAGLDAVNAIEDLDKLKSYYLLYATLGEFEERSNHFTAAAEHFRKALELVELKSERTFLARKLENLPVGADPATAGPLQLRNHERADFLDGISSFSSIQLTFSV